MGKVGAIASFFRKIGTVIFQGDHLAEATVKKLSQKNISIFDAAKEFSTNVSKYAEKSTNRILPTNPFPAMKKYWNKYHGTDKFSWWTMLAKEGRLGQWLVPSFIALTETGNIYRAFTDEKGGLFTGALEVGKTTARILGGTIGGILGSAFIPIPFLGPILGYMGGEWLTGRVVGKTFTETSSETSSEREAGGGSRTFEQAQAAAAAAMAGAAPTADEAAANYAQAHPQYTQIPSANNTYSYNPFSNNLSGYNNYADDFMAQSIFGNMNKNNQINQAGFAPLPTFNPTFNQTGVPAPNLEYLS